ncbi:MAG: dTDP-4-dehydrorhamnose 3,5-epimerase family protein [Coriobacteriia bacterium]|nr:dTDP-4-dehydrorhamnose 3,5-epimerase family protein [Coriobacteriia bacterium]
MIDGVRITPLRQIHDERGKVMKMMTRDDDAFRDFGEIYFSCVYPGAVKGWHIHREMWLNYAVVSGAIKFVLYDSRAGSPTFGEVQELFLSPENYALVTVPPGVWNGFKGTGTETAIVANCATIPHDPGEIDRLDPHDNDIPYDWTRRDG